MKKKKKKIVWHRINYDSTVTVWKPTCKCMDCSEIELSTLDFVSDGLPLCQECGEYFEYIMPRVKYPK
jgi:transcription elongation factor Elf1